MNFVGMLQQIQAIAAVANKKVRIVYTFGYGRYFCPNGHGWTSYRACITFDMKNLCVSKMWRQCEYYSNIESRLMYDYKMCPFSDSTCLIKSSFIF